MDKMFETHTIAVHCKSEEEVLQLLEKVPCNRSRQEAYHGWETYGKEVCYGIIYGIMYWYCGRNCGNYEVPAQANFLGDG